MGKYSHSEQKRIDLINKMKEDWEIDTQHLEIKLKPKRWYIKFWKWLTLTRYTVREVYIFVYNHFHDPIRIKSLMHIEFPFEHDNIKKPKEVPYNFAMQGGWTIPEEHLSKLIKGPLISEDGNRVLVPVDSRTKQIVRLILRFLGWLTIPGGIFGTWQLLKELLK